MPNTLRSLIEHLLPWYDRDAERRRDARTAQVARRSEDARTRAQKVIEEYERADDVLHR